MTRQAGSLAQKQIRLAPIIPSMALQKLTATLATMVLFGSGAAAAALADSPPTTTEPTTSTEITATTETTTSETTTTTSTETTTTPAETTTTAPTTSTTRPRHRLGGRLALSTLPPTERACPIRRRPTCDRCIRNVGSTDTESRGRSRSHPRSVRCVRLSRRRYLGLRRFLRRVPRRRPRKWHHGDDIFAALGAPVVAVANGTINRVGWHKRGGWRLWVRDAAADQFYYAHLSGYAPRVFHRST